MAGETGDLSSLLGNVVGSELSSEAAAAVAFAFMNSSKRRRIATKWTRVEDERVQALVKQHGARSWTLTSRQLPGRNPKQVRSFCNPNPTTVIPMMLTATPSQRAPTSIPHSYRTLHTHIRSPPLYFPIPHVVPRALVQSVGP